MRVVIVGGGVAGLGSALELGRAGHDVTVLERDPTPLPADPHAAFEWDRRGAPQVRHSHAFLARLRNLLRDHHPDVLAALLDAGATELRFTENLPPTLDDPRPFPGDEDLVGLACRRTTFEWVLRRTVMHQHGVDFRDGVGVRGLRAEAGSPPVVTGVELEDGGVIDADLVIAANGRRSAVPAWLAAIGSEPVPEAEEDTGIVYYSRFYRLRDGVELPPTEGPIGADLGYLKFAIFLGDNGTYSVTYAINDGDRDLRALRDPAAFDRGGRTLVPVAPWLEPGLADPLTEVHSMASLVNRRREFVVDGRPLVLGFAAVGDAAVCTNPLYGRGCSLGMVHAHLLAELLGEHAGDPSAFALAFDDATTRELVPWYDAAVAQDRANKEAAVAAREGTEAGPNMTDLLREALLPAVRHDAVVFRAFIRGFNLLTAPAALMQDADVMARVMAVYATRGERPEPDPLGPDRATFLEAVA